MQNKHLGKRGFIVFLLQASQKRRCLRAIIVDTEGYGALIVDTEGFKAIIVDTEMLELIILNTRSRQ